MMERGYFLNLTDSHSTLTSPLSCSSNITPVPVSALNARQFGFGTVIRPFAVSVATSWWTDVSGTPVSCLRHRKKLP